MTEPLDDITEIALRDRLRDGTPVAAAVVERLFAKLDRQTREISTLKATIRQLNARTH